MAVMVVADTDIVAAEVEGPRTIQAIIMAGNLVLKRPLSTSGLLVLSYTLRNFNTHDS